MAINYECIVKDFSKNLDYEIDHCADPHFLAFMASRYANGQVTDDDLTEMKGYRKGLKVAREIMQKIINIAEELDEGETNDD